MSKLVTDESIHRFAHRLQRLHVASYTLGALRLTGGKEQPALFDS